MAGFRSALPQLGLSSGSTTAGVRSMLAFWAGGATNAGATPTSPSIVNDLFLREDQREEVRKLPRHDQAVLQALAAFVAVQSKTRH